MNSVHDFRFPILHTCLLLAFALPALSAQMADNFADRPRVSSAVGTLSADTTFATLEFGETSRMHGSTRDRTVWAEWVAPADGWVTIDTRGTVFRRAMIAIYTGSGITSLSAAARSIAGFDSTPAVVGFPAAAGTAYQILLDGNAAYAYGLGSVNINLVAAGAPSVSSVVGADAFTARPVLAGTRAIGVANTLKAGRDIFEPDFPSSRGATVWWQWTAPANGRVTIDTLDSDYNTMLTVLAGDPGTATPFSGLDPVSANDDVPNAKTSQVAFQTEAGRTYQIMADGWGNNESSTGNVVLQLEFAPNSAPGAVPGADDFARRGILSGLNAAGVANSATFETEAFEVIPSGNKNTARWEWTAPENRRVTIDTLGTDFDTVLHLFSGTALDSLTFLGSNDNAPGTTCSAFAFTASAGTTYQIMVNGRVSGRGGNIVLNLNPNLESAPEIAVQQPAGSNLADGVTKKSFGTVRIGARSAAKTFTIRNTGTANLTGLAIGKTGSHSADFLTGGAGENVPRSRREHHVQGDVLSQGQENPVGGHSCPEQ